VDATHEAGCCTLVRFGREGGSLCTPRWQHAQGGRRSPARREGSGPEVPGPRPDILFFGGVAAITKHWPSLLLVDPDPSYSICHWSAAPWPTGAPAEFCKAGSYDDAGAGPGARSHILSTPAPQPDTLSTIPPTLSGSCTPSLTVSFHPLVGIDESTSCFELGQEEATRSRSGSSTPGRPRRSCARQSASAPASAARGPSTCASPSSCSRTASAPGSTGNGTSSSITNTSSTTHKTDALTTLFAR
jgi:hypothetical protein